MSEKGFVRKELRIEEITCVSNEDENCDFLVKLKENINLEGNG